MLNILVLTLNRSLGRRVAARKVRGNRPYAVSDATAAQRRLEWRANARAQAQSQLKLISGTRCGRAKSQGGNRLYAVAQRRYVFRTGL